MIKTYEELQSWIILDQWSRVSWLFICCRCFDDIIEWLMFIVHAPWPRSAMNSHCLWHDNILQSQPFDLQIHPVTIVTQAHISFANSINLDPHIKKASKSMEGVGGTFGLTRKASPRRWDCSIQSPADHLSYIGGECQEAKMILLDLVLYNMFSGKKRQTSAKNMHNCPPTSAWLMIRSW